MDWSFVYLILALTVMTLAMLTRDNVKHWLGVILLWDWTIANYCVFSWGFANAPTPLAVSELGFAIVAAGIGHQNRSFLALAIVAGFGLQEVVQVAARLNGSEGNYLYYASLNVIYALQLLVVGGASAEPFLRRAWVRHFHPVPDRHNVAGRDRQ